MASSRAQTYPSGRADSAGQRHFTYHRADGFDPELIPIREPVPKSASPVRLWLFELASLVASISCLIAILILLLVYRDRTVPELSMGLTFNAVISVLITAANVAMLSAVGSAMGQIKWKWFRKRSSLRNLDIFDEVSRGGPWGAVDFLMRIKWRSTAAGGSIVLLLSLAMDPFAQQLLT